MPFNAALRIAATVAAFVISLAAPATAYAGPSNNAARPHRLHHFHHATYRSRMIYQSPIPAGGERLPPAPEYGFLTHVPPNAMRMPGYTFVPGKGIIGESCDLPTSACSNQYRDVQ